MTTHACHAACRSLCCMCFIARIIRCIELRLSFCNRAACTSSCRFLSRKRSQARHAMCMSWCIMCLSERTTRCMELSLAFCSLAASSSARRRAAQPASHERKAAATLRCWHLAIVLRTS